MCLLALFGRECQIRSTCVALSAKRTIGRFATCDERFAITIMFHPLSNHLFIESAAEDKKTKSGIVIPDSAEKEKPMVGNVVAVGPGKMNERGERVAMSVKVGDKVLFKKYGPDEIEIEGKKYLVGDEDDVLAVIE